MDHDFEQEQEQGQGHEYRQAPPPRGNTIGLVGFILSLVAIPTCGALSLPGLICSAIGLRRQPRGLAIAGTIISVLGVLWLGLVVVFVVSPPGKTAIAMFEAVMKVEEYRKEHEEVPSQDEGDRLLSGIDDGWGHPMQYERTESGYVVRSAGPDGELHTADDISQSK